MDARDARDTRSPSRPLRPWGNDGVTIPCPICQRAFMPRGRQRVCSAACRQAAWRRHPAAVASAAGTLPLPTPSPRIATVYECPSCGTRYLGEQRCPDCQQFCRRIGPGGRCPHCDEPVTLDDLLPVAVPAVKGGARSLDR